MKDFLKNQKGVTLTEVIIYIGIVSIIVVGVISIIVQLVQLKLRADSIGTIVSETSDFLDRLNLDIRNCDNFSVEDEINLEVTKAGVTTRYYLQDARIYFNDGENIFPITSNLVQVSSLEFVDWTTPNSENLLHIKFELVRGGTSERFQTSIHKR